MEKSLEKTTPNPNATALQIAFDPFFERIAEMTERAMVIKVTNLTQTAEMEQARGMGLIVKDLRKRTEKTRKELKEDALRHGQAIDKVAKMIQEAIAPIETHLKNQEEFAERLLEKEQADQRDIRMSEAGKLLAFFPSDTDFGKITDEEFSNMLGDARMMWKEREAETAARIERERVEAEGREAMRIESIRLKEEAAKREVQITKEREAVQKAEREYNAKIAAANAENDRLKREVEAKQRAEAQRIEAENNAKILAEKTAKEAPDREKLRKLADAYAAIPKPDFDDEEWDSKYRLAMDYISKGIKYIREQ